MLFRRGETSGYPHLPSSGFDMETAGRDGMTKHELNLRENFAIKEKVFEKGLNAFVALLQNAWNTTSLRKTDKQTKTR